MNHETIQEIYSSGKLDAFETFYRLNVSYSDIEDALGEAVEHEFATWVFYIKECA